MMNGRGQRRWREAGKRLERWVVVFSGAAVAALMRGAERLSRELLWNMIRLVKALAHHAEPGLYLVAGFCYATHCSFFPMHLDAEAAYRAMALCHVALAMVHVRRRRAGTAGRVQP